MKRKLSIFRLSTKYNMSTFRYCLPVLLALCVCPFAQSQSTNSAATAPETELYRKLKSLPGVVEVKEMHGDSRLFQESYEVMFEQPLDHQHPDGEKFRQRLFLSHNDYATPVLLETEGYAAHGNSA